MTPIVMQTPRSWWRDIPDEQRPAWQAAVDGAPLPPELAQELDAAGFVLPRWNGAAYLPPQLAEAILDPSRHP